jgi:hypothetical protein
MSLIFLLLDPFTTLKKYFFHFYTVPVSTRFISHLLNKAHLTKSNGLTKNQPNIHYIYRHPLNLLVAYSIAFLQAFGRQWIRRLFYLTKVWLSTFIIVTNFLAQTQCWESSIFISDPDFSFPDPGSKRHRIPNPKAQQRNQIFCY